MTVKTCLMVYFVILLCVTGCNSAVSGVKISSQQLTSLEKCDLPRGAYEPVPMKFNAQIITAGNTTLLNMNWTVERKTSPLTVRIRIYRMVGNRKILDHELDRLSCKNPLMELVWQPLKFKYDKSCRMLPGTAFINRLNLDYYFRNPRKFGYMQKGSVLYEFYLYTKKGVWMCLSARTEQEN